VNNSLVQASEGGGLVFGDVVARVADSLSPLGAAARMFAEAGALVVDFREMQLEQRHRGRKLDVEEKRADNAKEIRLAELAERRRSSSTALREMRTRLGDAELSAKSLRTALNNMQRDMGRARGKEKSYYMQIIQTLTVQLVQHHGVQSNSMVDAIDSVLNGAGAVAATPAGIDVPAWDATAPAPRRPRRTRGPR
jgi:NAD(P)-dependent dehydrogenase (short-subunit alcohol dehydrogenase family)